MAIYRGEGGKTDVIPADGDQEFAGSIIAEKDIHAHGNISADGDITIGGNLHWEGTVTGDGSGLENVPTPFLQADDCIYLNNQVISNDYIMPVGKNGMTAGDITVNGEVTIPDGSDWHIVGTQDGVVTLESLGIPNHDLLSVDENGVLTGDGSGLYNLNAYTIAEMNALQQVQDEAIQANTDLINSIPAPVDSYTKEEVDAQQSAQDVKIDKNTSDLTNVYTKTEVDDLQSAQDVEIAKKIEDAPEDGEQYVRKDGVWAELAAADGGIADAPADGKTYGRKDLKWEEVVADGYTEAETDALLNDKADKADTYTKAEVDAQQLVQDAEITANTTDIATNTADIAENKTNIQQNTTDIESLIDDVDALTGSIIYKGSLNATVTPAPADAVEGDMWINEYNVSEPSTNYPVASGWAPVTEVKYDDKLIKTDTGWDKIASVVGVPSYTAGEIDDLLDDKADKTDVYTKTEIDDQQNVQDVEIAKKANTDDTYTKTQTDVLLDSKANVGDSYLKTETYNNVEVDTKLFEKADKATTYTKTEVDNSQALQNTEIAKKADKDFVDTELAKKADKETTYTKDEVDSLLESASGAIVGNYTNKHASGGVARDPLAGNLYLSNGMSFSTDYNAVTSIYISDTDGDGDVRDFDKVKENDKVTLSSENGSGEYTIVTITDVGGYRELIVNTEDSNGTIANDTAVSLVLDVASSSESGGIEEAPADGKQYARQDKSWTEVTSSGDVVAQPPVVMSSYLTSSPTIPNSTWTKVPFDAVSYDTNNCFNTTDNRFQPNVAGYYNVTFAVRFNGNIESSFGAIYLNGIEKYSTYNSVTQLATSLLVEATVYMNGSSDYIEAFVLQSSAGEATISELPFATYFQSNLISGGSGGSGGGVTAQPPVAFSLGMTSDLTVAPNTDTIVSFNNADIDTDNGLTGNTYVVKKAGLYDLSYSAKVGKIDDMIWVSGYLKVNGNNIIVDNYNFDYNTKVSSITLSNSKVVQLEIGDEISVSLKGATSSNSSFECYLNDTFLSGHMVSSITEGEVKEKEAVAFYKRGAGGDITVATGEEYPWTGGNYFEAPVDGWYNLNANVMCFNGESANALFAINGVQNADVWESQEQAYGLVSISKTTELKAGDKVTVEVRSGNKTSYVFMGHSNFHGHLITGQSTGGGSGGGSYTPEKMVWEDKLSEREFLTEYTNTNDVPLYLSVTAAFPQDPVDKARRFALLVDGKTVADAGRESTVTLSDFPSSKSTLFFIIPAGSTYEVFTSDIPTKLYWHEARMPVAVGTGGKTVAFRGELSAKQEGLKSSTWTKVNLDEASIDTDNAFTNGKFQPSVAGYYQVNGGVGQACTPISTATVCAIYKNGTLESSGTSYVSPTSAGKSAVSDVIYLNGTTDYLELFGWVDSSGTCGFFEKNSHTYLSAVLVSGGSASGGDSATLESLGIPNHDKVVIDENGSIGTGNLDDTSNKNVAQLVVNGLANGGRNALALRNHNLTTPSYVRFGRMGSGNDTSFSITNNYHRNSGYQADDLNFGVSSLIFGSSGTVSMGTAPAGNNDATTRLKVDKDGRVDITGSLYVNNTPKSLDVMVTDLEKDVKLKDKLIEKLSARLDKLEKRIK